MGGVFKDSVDTEGEEAKKWVGIEETYQLNQIGESKYLFTVEVGIEKEYEEMFAESWLRAVERIKQLSEK
ncbi:MAG: hypothetical protein RIC35_01855 [Marinoscillum sp.]